MHNESLQHNAFLCAKALVAFDAQLSMMNYENLTPLDVAVANHGTQSLEPFLREIGAKYAQEVREMDRENSLDPSYENEFMENPNASYFGDEEVEEEQGSIGAGKSIRTRFGLDSQLMSLRLTSVGGSVHSPHIQADYYGDTALEFHDHRFEEIKRPTSLHQPHLASLQEGQSLTCTQCT